MKISEAFKQPVPLYQRGGKTEWDPVVIANAMAEVKEPVDYSKAYNDVIAKADDITTAKQAKNGTFAFRDKENKKRIYTITAQGFLRYEEDGNTLTRGRYRTNSMTSDLRANYIMLLERLADILNKRDKSKPIAEAFANEEAETLTEGAIGPFWPAAAKLRRLHKALNHPAATLTTPRIWEVITSALADRLSFKDITALEEEIAARVGEKDGKKPEPKKEEKPTEKKAEKKAE